MIGYYFNNVSSLSILNVDRMEKLALNISSLAIYSSEWAAKSAIDYYKVPEEKVKVIPFGANINEIPNRSELKHEIKGPIKLLFIGKD